MSRHTRQRSGAKSRASASRSASVAHQGSEEKKRKRTMLEPIIYCARMMNAHTASVAVFPNLFKNIWAIGCPRLLFMRPSRSWPMQNARVMFTAMAQRLGINQPAETKIWMTDQSQECQQWKRTRRWTTEQRLPHSKPPQRYVHWSHTSLQGKVSFASIHGSQRQYAAQMVHTGAKKLKMNTKPFGQLYTVGRHVNDGRRRPCQCQITDG
jgi:hypothetical protein